jgi:hypothetical protein
MRSPVEIRYAGVSIGRAESLEPLASDAEAYFLPLKDPMPVGTELELDAGGDLLAARVVKVIEADAAGAGMEVRLGGSVRARSPKTVVVGEPAARTAGADGDLNGVPESVAPELSGAGSGPSDGDGGPGDAGDPGGGRRRRKRRR